MPSNDESKWVDRLETQLNACSLETLYTPAKNNRYPLVIGCYQLNERSESSDQNSSYDDSGEKEEGTKPGSNDDDDDGTEAEEEAETKVETETDAKAKTKASRSGELMLFSMNEELKLSEHQQKNTLSSDGSGVLDGKWLQSGPFQFSDSNSKSSSGSEALGASDVEYFMYATANASGALNLYRLNILEEKVEEEGHESGTSISASASESTSMQLQQIGSSGVYHNGLALSLAWDESSYKYQSQSTSRIVSSYSDGTVALHRIENANDETIHNHNYNTEAGMQVQAVQEFRWNAHTLFGCPSEVWTACFASNRHYATHADTVISGGDDCQMKLWDLRLCSSASSSDSDSASCSSNHNPKPIAVQKDFEAGVTAVAYHPSLEHIFAVGSYDEGVRIWDMRKVGGRSDPLGNVQVGGGVWRIKWHPKDPARMLVGAMHGGCRILDIPGIRDHDGDSHNGSTSNDSDSMGIGGTLEMNIVKEFTEHRSMAYGADWIYEEHGRYEAAASCSFYDRQAFVWE